MFFDPIGRAELKYYFPIDMVEGIRNFISQYAEPDPFAARMPGYTYYVRSIYFDTDSFDFFYDKQDGLAFRKKLRVRAYNEFSPDRPAFLEIKRRRLNRIIKERASVPLHQIEMIHNELKVPVLTDSNSVLVRNVIKKYITNLTTLNLRPSALIAYDREAYIGLIDPGERVTIDKDVKGFIYPELADLFSDKGLTPVTNGLYILELKFDRFMPKWMANLVRRFQLKCESIPKYCQGIQKCMDCGIPNIQNGLTAVGKL